MAAGTSTIIARSISNTSITGTSTVTVNAAGGGGIAVTGVTLSSTAITLTPTQTSQLTRTLAPTGATNPNVGWISSNPAVATVSATGLVTAVAMGTATITCTSIDGGFRATASVTVNNTGAATYYSTRLAGTPTERYGLAKSISVMPGDIITTEVFVKYLDATPANWTAALNAFMNAIAMGTAPTGTLVDGGAPGSGGQVPIPPIDHSSETGTDPKAYLNYIVLDKNMSSTPLNFGFKRVSSTAREYGQDVLHQRLSFDGAEQIVIKEPGYIYIYLSNENGTPLEVYFDDFKVTHTKSPIVQTDDYYPFGLTFNSYARENSVLNKYLYNEKELQDELNLSIYDYGARSYDPTLGRWWQLDPFSNAYYSYSPYSYVTNNPVIYIDENGQFKIPIHRRITQNALNRLGFFNRWFRFDLLAGNTIISDIFGAGEDRHFDGRNNFKEVNDTWNALNSEIKNASPGNTTWGGAETQHFGKLLHNVQDFYSHSNYIELFIDWYVRHFGSTPSSVEIPTYDEAVASPAYEDFRKNYLEKNLKTGEFNLGRWIAGNDAKKTNEEGNIHHDQLAKDKRNVGQNYGGTTLHDLAVYVATVHTMNVLNSASGGSSGNRKKKQPDADEEACKRSGGCK